MVFSWLSFWVAKITAHAIENIHASRLFFFSFSRLMANFSAVSRLTVDPIETLFWKLNKCSFIWLTFVSNNIQKYWRKMFHSFIACAKYYWVIGHENHRAFKTEIKKSLRCTPLKSLNTHVKSEQFGLVLQFWLSRSYPILSYPTYYWVDR